MLQWLTTTGVRCAFVLARVALTVGAAALVTSSPATAARDPPPEPAHVRLEVFADHRSIGPGESFRVAVVQHIDRAWHTYWINPGDAGLATQIKWTVPQGYSVGHGRLAGAVRLSRRAARQLRLRGRSRRACRS